jgi:S1-C subfamily serine protease
VNGKEVANAVEAARELQKIPAGRLAQLRVWRGDKEIFVPVKKN